MELKVNGKLTHASDSNTVTSLLEAQSIDPSRPGIAVAVNDKVVPRNKWPLTRLSDGDAVEIIHAVQGG